MLYSKRVEDCSCRLLNMVKHYCESCKKEQEFEYYDGCLGYESFICSVCRWDINEKEK